MNNTNWQFIESEILPFVEKPARYTGGEVNSTVKDHKGKTSVALIYPDIYEVGVSNIGLKILYGILNHEKNIVCERAYAPWGDMEKLLREKNTPLYGLESKKPLGEFDILGFSFQYELLYTNFLNMLDLSGIPFHSSERNLSHPFIIAGGPAAVNPEPVARFLDAVVIGDGEPVVVKIVSRIAEGKKRNQSRTEILRGLSEIKGVYVPSLYEEMESDGWVIPRGKKTEHSFVCDLEKTPFVTNQILPNIQAVQDRAVVEAARGCTRGCRFCQAGMTYRPVRERSVANILNLARESIKKTGYHEFSLISLSISDYSGLPALIEKLDEQFAPHGMSFSLPSLRLDSFTLELAKKVSGVRKSGLTFAVEGGTMEIRNAINKGVSEEELFQVVRIAKGEGWKSVKLYFMIGLPGNDPAAEIEGIAGLCERIANAHRDMSMTVSVAVFIPKPHTPYQWAAQLSPETGKAKFHDLLYRLKRYRRINIRYNSPEISWLEGIFARGDRKLSKAVERAFRSGARFDGWNDRIDLDLWKKAFQDTGIDPEFYLREKDTATELPWENISTGVTRKFLLSELEKSVRGEATRDCREACYNSCGNCDLKTERPDLRGGKSAVKAKIDKNFLNNISIGNAPKFLLRFIYTKTGAMKFINPIDLEEAISRAFIRSNIPVSYTQGYNPHIRIEMGWAIPIGFESVYEPAEVELSKSNSPLKIMKLLNATLPPGIRILHAKVMKPPHYKLSKKTKDQMVSFKINSEISAENIENNLKNADNYQKISKKGEKTINLNDYITEIQCRKGFIEATYRQTDGGARIQDIIMGLTGFEVRKAVALKPLILKRFIEINGRKTSLFDY